MGKIAVIDIGSNSVRLMTWADGKTLYKRLSTTRLGEGIAHSSVLRKDAILRTAEAVAQYCRDAEKEGAEKICAFATAAVRTAKNGREFCAQVKRLCNLETDVVSGEEEAQLALEGVLSGGDGGIIDIGGASTEVCFRKEGKIMFTVSLPVGAVRLYDECGEEKARLLSVISEKLRPLAGKKAVAPVYAVGGTATTVAAVLLGLKEYDAARVQNYEMTADAVSVCADNLLFLPKERRMELAGMDIRRADIIAGGALLLSEVIKALSLPKIAVSDRDNLEGYLYRRCLN